MSYAWSEVCSDSVHNNTAQDKKVEHATILHELKMVNSPFYPDKIQRPSERSVGMVSSSVAIDVINLIVMDYHGRGNDR